MDNMLQIIRQEENEARFNRRHIDGYIRQAITNSPDMVQRMAHGVALLGEYQAKSYYASKNARIAQLQGLDMAALVLEIFVGIAYCLKEALFTSVTSQLAGRLKFSDRTEAITTVAEIVAVLCGTDAFDINKASKGASLVVLSRIPLEDRLVEFIRNSRYLPPMVCEPLELLNNHSSGYLSHTDSLILGKGNHHSGDICLDVLNRVNKVALRLDTDFVGQVEEDPNTEFTLEKVKEAADKKGQFISDEQALARLTQQRENWQAFKQQGYELYLLLATQGNEFYLTNKVDKRGRLYSQGYHLNLQGTAFKKACLELANQELVDGAP